jgi:hypothetical protein
MAKTPQQLIADAISQSFSITTDESISNDSDITFLFESHCECEKDEDSDKRTKRKSGELEESANDILFRINALGLKKTKLPGTNTRANAKWENDDWELLLGDGSVGGGSKDSKWRAVSKKHSGSDASRFSNSFKDVENHIKTFKK